MNIVDKYKIFYSDYIGSYPINIIKNLYNNTSFRLTRRQEEMLENTNKYRVFIGYRQVGLSVGAVLEAIATCIAKENCSILFDSRYEIGDLEVTRSIYKSVKNLNIEQHIISINPNKQMLFKNGSSITLGRIEDIKRKFTDIYIDNGFLTVENIDDLMSNILIHKNNGAKMTFLSTSDTKWPRNPFSKDIVSNVLKMNDVNVNIWQDKIYKQAILERMI